MKKWKKLVVVPVLSLALGFVGGHITSPKLQPVVERVFAGAVNYSELVERYGDLGIDGLVSEDFSLSVHKGGGKYLSIIENNHSAVKEELSLTCTESWRKKQKEDSYNTPLYDLIITNRKDLYFKIHYDSNKEPYVIEANIFNPEYNLGDENPASGLFGKKEKLSRWDRITITKYNGFFFVEKNYSLYDVEDEKSIKKIKELFESASKNCKTVKDLVEKQ